MASITTRAGKGAPLTNAELDANFNNLNNDKIESADTRTLTNKTISGSNNTLSNIDNSSLTNSSITFGATSQALGSTVSALNGVSIGGTTRAAGSFTTLDANGNVTLGDATSDTITATGRFNTDLVPSTDNARDLGTTALKWKQAYATNFTENGFPVVSQTDIGSAPNQIPLNQYLGNLAYQNADAIAGNVGLGGNLTFTGTGNRIIGDFSNATTANRVFFQTSTANSQTAVGILPNGTANTSNLFIYSSSSDPANSSVMQLRVGGDGGLNGLASTRTGTGTFLPMTFWSGGSERMRIDTSGNVGIGTSSPVGRLRVSGSDAATIALVNGGTRGVRFGADSIGALIEGVDNTGTGSYQPLFVGGSDVRFTTSNTERMRIDSSGNVYVGSTTGSYKLTVSNGRGGFTGSQNVGSMLTATGALGGAECVSATGSDAAFMAFQRPGAYASYFGIDTDNSFAVGGWSAGAGLANFKCGALSKSSGSFKIDHPLPELTETHHLVHSFVEAPQADNIYRGKVELVDGRAEVNIDTNSGMTEGTFVLLNREVQCFTSNESDWDAVRGFVNGNILTIECQNASSTATISWLVIGERQDRHMYDTDWTDENGKVIVEPLKTPTQMEGN
jgi:hypothetical protein